MVPPTTSVLYDLLHTLVAQMAQMGMVWGATGFAPHACAMHDASALKSRALVYAAVIDLCERRVIEAYSSMERVWPPGIMAFWPCHTPSLWTHGDDVLRSCVTWLIDVDGAKVVEQTLRLPLLRSLALLADPKYKRDALLAIGDWREMDVKQTTPSAIGIGKPDQVIDYAVAAAVEAATSEHHARVIEMKAELAQMRDFETQVLKDNHRLRAENALLLGR
jgi:hypothetical protein